MTALNTPSSCWLCELLAAQGFGPCCSHEPRTGRLVVGVLEDEPGDENDRRLKVGELDERRHRISTAC